MKTEKWNPGHTIHGGYPHDAIHSADAFKNRPRVEQDKETKKIYVGINPEVWGEVNEENIKDFLIHRLFDYSNALDIAEGQIQDMLTEDPFMPEDFGFELIHKPKEMKDAVMRIYGSVYDDRYTLYRKPVSTEDTLSDIDPSMWVLMKADKEASIFTTQELSFPCARIAYAVFSSMKIPMLPPQHEAEAVEPSEQVITTQNMENDDIKLEL